MPHVYISFVRYWHSFVLVLALDLLADPPASQQRHQLTARKLTFNLSTILQKHGTCRGGREHCKDSLSRGLTVGDLGAVRLDGQQLLVLWGQSLAPHGRDRVVAHERGKPDGLQQTQRGEGDKTLKDGDRHLE